MMFTSKWLMESMGFKVGDKIVYSWLSENFYRTVTYLESCEWYCMVDECDGKPYHLSELIGHEFFRLPEYDLTHAEKIIVQNISDKYKYIFRHPCGTLFASTHPYQSTTEEVEVFTELDVFNHLFKFIKRGKEINLDDYRRCL